jgi:hypothetical protein
MRFIGGTYTGLDGLSVTFPTITFETVIITAKMNKVIKKTSILGRDTGTIKEYIGLGDWDVQIRAVITPDAAVATGLPINAPEGGNYPYDNIDAAFSMFTAPISIPIDCWWLQQLNITHLVIESVDLEQTEGSFSYQRLVLTCTSDNPLIIKLVA